MTHGPPHMILDTCKGNNFNAGDAVLRKTLEERVKPLVNCFGHIHECYGVEKHRETTFINGSTCNFAYGPYNAPIVFDVNVKDKKATIRGPSQFT